MDFMPKHAGIVLGVCTFVVLAAGCQSSTVLPNQMNRARLDAIEAVRLQVNTVSNTLNVDHQANELNLNIPVAAVTAAQVGAMTTDRDTAAVGGIVGTFLGIQIAKNMHQSKLQEAANLPVLALKSQLDAAGFHHRAREMLQEKLASKLSERFPHIPLHSAGDGDHAALLANLDVSLTQDISSLHLRVETFMQTGKQPANRTGNRLPENPVYAREIDYYDNPLGNASTQAANLLAARWNADEGKVFWERLAKSIDAVAKLIADDLDRDFHPGTPGGKPIRYRNERGQFYERGDIVETTEQRLLIRTLRGGLLSVPGQLTEQ